MIGFLVAVIIAVLLLALLWYALGLLPMPEPVRTIILIIVALVVLLFILGRFNVW